MSENLSLVELNAALDKAYAARNRPEINRLEDLIAELEIKELQKKEWLGNNTENIKEVVKMFKEIKSIEDAWAAINFANETFPRPVARGINLPKKAKTPSAGKASYRWNEEVSKNCKVDASGKFVKEANKKGVVGLVFMKGPTANTPIR